LSNRIRQRLSLLDDSRKLMIPFLTAGYPDRKTFANLFGAAAEARADIIEIGIPFSDPLADGPAIQYSSQKALENGITLSEILKTVADLRSKSQTPIVLMGYYNPIVAFGVESFIHSAAASGVDGLIVPDLPVDEAIEFRKRAELAGLSLIFLAAPTSTDSRIKRIDRMSSDFVYAVTVTGVTGTGKKFDVSTDKYLKHLKAILKSPFVAGFGVSSPSDARRLTRYADGIVIGSALIRLIQKAKSRRQAVMAVESFLSSIRKAV